MRIVEAGRALHRHVLVELCRMFKTPSAGEHKRFAMEELASGQLAHPLVEEGIASINCAQCTDRVAACEDARGELWRGHDKATCVVLLSTAPSRAGGAK